MLMQKEYELFKIRLGSQPITMRDLKNPKIKNLIVNSLEYRV